jgi:hypothetical protein
MLAGLALSDGAWRWAQASRQGGFEVAHEPLQPGWVVNGLIVALGPVQLALIRLVDRLALGASGAKPPARVAMSLPSSAVLMHRTWVPQHLSERALQQLCREQATDWLPLPLSEMVLEVALNEAVTAQSTRGDQAPDEGAAHQAAWVAATRLERVTQALSLSESAGLTLCVLETESCAYRRAVLESRMTQEAKWPFGSPIRSPRGASLRQPLGQLLALCWLSQDNTQLQLLQSTGLQWVLLEEQTLAWSSRHWALPPSNPSSIPESGLWALPEAIEGVLNRFLQGQKLNDQSQDYPVMGAPSSSSSPALPAWAAIYVSGSLPDWLLDSPPAERRVKMNGQLGMPVDIFVFAPLVAHQERSDAPDFSVACGLVQRDNHAPQKS